MYFIVLLVVSTCTYHAYVSMDRSPTGGICRPWNQWLPWNPAQEIFVNCYRIWRPWSNKTRCKCKFMLNYVCSYSCGVDFSNVYMFYGCLFHPSTGIEYVSSACFICILLILYVHIYIYTVYMFIYMMHACRYTCTTLQTKKSCLKAGWPFLHEELNNFPDRHQKPWSTKKRTVSRLGSGEEVAGYSFFLPNSG